MAEETDELGDVPPPLNRYDSDDEDDDEDEFLVDDLFECF